MKKLTPNQKAYKQQVQRIKRAIKRLEKQGFYLNTDLSSIIGITPKRITKQAINRLKSIKPRNLYKYTDYVDFDSGEVYDYKTGKEIVKQRKAYEKRMSDYIPSVTTYELILEQLKNIKNSYWFSITKSSVIEMYQSEVFIIEEILKEKYLKFGKRYNRYLTENENLIMRDLEIVQQYEKTISNALSELAKILSYDGLSEEEEEEIDNLIENITGENVWE